jgi:prepilin signal peptidase PulO-like enzyme (type II secretory pathway)
LILSLNNLKLLIFIGVLITVSIIDLKKKRIPDLLTGAGFLALLALTLASNPKEALWFIGCAITGFGVIWLIRRVSGGKIGLGDAKLSALISATLGLVGWFSAIFIASLTGLSVALVLVLTGRLGRRSAIPFAPFLSAGSICYIILSRIEPGFPFFWAGA